MKTPEQERDIRNLNNDLHYLCKTISTRETAKEFLALIGTPLAEFSRKWGLSEQERKFKVFKVAEAK